MKITCQVVEDLLPLYHDGVCSEDSRKIVEEHLKTCEKCGKMNRVLEEEPKQEIREDVKVAKGIRKSVRNKVIRGIAMGIALCLALAVCGFGIGYVNWEKERQEILRFAEGKEDNKPYRHIWIGGEWDGRDETFEWSDQDGAYRFTISIPDPFRGKPEVIVRSIESMKNAQSNDWSAPYIWIELEGYDEDGYYCRVGVSKWNIGLYETFLLRVIREEETSGFELVEGTSIHQLLWDGNRERIDALIQAAEAQWPFLTE